MFLWKPKEPFELLRHQRRLERPSLATALPGTTVLPPPHPLSAKDHTQSSTFEGVYFICLEVEHSVNLKCLGAHGQQHREAVTSKLLS